MNGPDDDIDWGAAAAAMAEAIETAERTHRAESCYCGRRDCEYLAHCEACGLTRCRGYCDAY